VKITTAILMAAKITTAILMAADFWHRRRSHERSMTRT
jgi:hypothetical protein